LTNLGFNVRQAISDEEIKWVCTVMNLPADAFCGTDGDDPRLGVMRSLESLDVEACPGSGKTTLLVAKLAILANRWKSKGQGICVLSHTNAARTEIGDRLSSTSAGHLLLRYPHFVGTIHSFVNEFLAIPWLRSKGWPIKSIDTEIALRDRWRRLPRGTRIYLERQHGSPAALGYTRNDFSGGGKDDFSSGTATHRNMLKACRESTAEGYFCFDEMFVWASELLDHRPEVIKTVRARFPIVFLDEVQDNSELQSAFLHRLLMTGDGSVVRQRFGDSNQAIYHRSGVAGAVTDIFPGPNKTDLPNSFRFGQTIADHADPLGVRPHQLVGRGPATNRIAHGSCQSVLFLFDNASVLNVLPAYAEHLIATFPPEVLTRGDFTAVAGVHRAKTEDRLPRFMGHYAPDYNPDVAGKQSNPGSFVQYLSRARLDLATSRSTHSVVNNCAEGILQLARQAGAEVSTRLRKSANRRLLEGLPDDEARKRYIDLLDQLISSRCELSKEAWTTDLIPTVLALGQAIAGCEIGSPLAKRFLGWTDEEATEAGAGTSKVTNLFRYPYDTPKISIRLGSIHGVKGETHTATLVLESFHQSHHLKKLLPWLTGKRPKKGMDNTGENTALIDRLKLHYVAMTRPSHLLALAMRKDAFSDSELDLMRNRNWRIVECVRLA
jgi:hypothetical protein